MDRTGKIVMVYDEPAAICAKLWLRDAFTARGHKVRTIFSRFRISNVEQRGKAGKLAARLLTLWQCMKALAVSGRGDVVVCWSQWSGLFFNLLPGAGGRYIISCNWLTPVPNRKTRFLYVKALRNRRLTAVINHPGTKARILEGYGVEDTGNIVCVPDVYDDRDVFREPIYPVGSGAEKYCFCGGRANRDWEFLLKAAAECPRMEFRLVAAKSGWDSKWEVPGNVRLYFDLGAEEYYGLLEHAYMSVYPLKEERVSGLINILKSVQMGKPVLVTKQSFTEAYFPGGCRDWLVPSGDMGEWKRMLGEVWDYGQPEYVAKVKRMQEHIRENFSPESAGRQMEEIIARCKGADREHGEG